MDDYTKMANAIHYLTGNSRNQPSLSQLAKMTGLSAAHFQRKFKSWVGITPKSFLQYVTYIEARDGLINGQDITVAALESGLSGPGRLHDLCIKLDSASPGEIKKMGNGLKINYGFGPTPFGRCLIGISTRGICYLSFVQQKTDRNCIGDLHKTWPHALISRDDKLVMDYIRKIFSFNNRSSRLDAFVSGSRFQLQVWRGLINIPEGRLVSYGALATSLDKPRAARAVGSAVAQNYLAYLIPCHRVIRSTGATGEYRWGSRLKKQIIAMESARARNLSSGPAG